jgi:hypothetical protein
MITVIYQEWLSDWDKKLWKDGHYILLLQDNFSAHTPPDDLTNIHVENFTANLTAHVQPVDTGIIHNFKAHYCTKFVDCAIDCYNSDPPSEIYQINQLEAMRMVAAAWDELDATTIHCCWKHTGILPENLFTSTTITNPFIPISSLLNVDSSSSSEVASELTPAEKTVTDGLMELEKRGMLQKKNQMDLEELLNPPEENASPSQNHLR